ncbi:MAG TPA: DUF535 family protein [Phenylobacterium sp.]|nr:DUF535 family protein [Phenylobacterium sp.]
MFKHIALVLQFSSGRYQLFKANIPKLLTRYTREYLSLSFGVPERREIFLFHHRLLLEKFEADFLSRVAERGVNIWKHVSGDDKYSIRMSMDRSVCGEGDLVLEFRENGAGIFDMSFTFAPGHVVGSEAASAMLVARVQGRPNRFDAIRQATKACGDIFPGHVLLAAAEGVAAAISTRVLCGVSTERQLSSRWGIARFNYDGFWADLLEERRGDWYCAAVPIPRKPLAEVSIAHRRRTKRKRRFKDSVTGQVRQLLAQHLR